MISWRSKQSLGTAMCLKQIQLTISTFLWGHGAVMSGRLIRRLKREERQETINHKKLRLSVWRLKDRNGIFIRHLMIALMILLRSKHSLGTAMCLPQIQVTISTFLWGSGAVISDGLTKLSKREERQAIHFQKLT